MDCGEVIWIAVQTLAEAPACPTFCTKACEQSYEKYFEGEKKKWQKSSNLR
jgi:hypothetical protein